MKARTKLLLVKVAGLLLVLPMAFLLISVAANLNGGLLVQSSIVGVPLVVYGTGFYFILDGYSERTREPNPSGA